MPAVINYVPCSPWDGRGRIVDTLHKDICIASNNATLAHSIDCQSNPSSIASASASNGSVELIGCAKISSTRQVESLPTVAIQKDLELTLASTLILITCGSESCQAYWMDSVFVLSVALCRAPIDSACNSCHSSNSIHQKLVTLRVKFVMYISYYSISIKSIIKSI